MELSIHNAACTYPHESISDETFAGHRTYDGNKGTCVGITPPLNERRSKWIRITLSAPALNFKLEITKNGLLCTAPFLDVMSAETESLGDDVCGPRECPLVLTHGDKTCVFECVCNNCWFIHLRVRRTKYDEKNYNDWELCEVRLLTGN